MRPNIYFEVINICHQVSSELSPVVSGKNQTANIVSLGSFGLALEILDAKRIFDLAVILLNIPSNRTCSPRIVGQCLVNIIGYHLFRATVDCRHSLQFDLECARQPVDLDEFSVDRALFAPLL